MKKSDEEVSAEHDALIYGDVLNNARRWLPYEPATKNRYLQMFPGYDVFHVIK